MRCEPARARVRCSQPVWSMLSMRPTRSSSTWSVASRTEAGLGRLPAWLTDAIGHPAADAVLVTPHWGPNMSPDPVARVRSAARSLIDAGATVIAGHSAHLFHGVQGRVLYDLGDFIDDYATEPDLRNDLGLLFVLGLDDQGPVRVEGVPLRLEFCHTRLAERDEAAWIERRFREAC